MFNLSKKKINKIMAFAIAFTMLFASQVTAFAATTSSKTVTSSKAMSVALLPGVTGNSNTITFNFNSLPDKAIVKEVEIDCSNASVIGGKGAILAKSLMMFIMRMEVVKCVLVRECRVYLNYLESDKTIAKHLLTEMRHFLRHQ